MDKVRGLERFREHFAGNEERYALIGGADCMNFSAKQDFRFEPQWISTSQVIPWTEYTVDA